MNSNIQQLIHYIYYFIHTNQFAMKNIQYMTYALTNNIAFMFMLFCLIYFTKMSKGVYYYIIYHHPALGKPVPPLLKLWSL